MQSFLRWLELLVRHVLGPVGHVLEHSVVEIVEVEVILLVPTEAVVVVVVVVVDRGKTMIPQVFSLLLNIRLIRIAKDLIKENIWT